MQLKKKLTYWTLIFLLTIGVTICVELIFRHFRLVHLADTFLLGIIEFLFAAILLPYYVATICIYFQRTFQIVGQPVLYGIILLLCLIVASGLDFINWQDTSAKLVDPESRDVIEIGLILQFVIGLLFCAQAFFYFIRKTKISET